MVFELRQLQPALDAICHAHRVKRLGLFGSAAREELRPDSDVDILVEFLPEAHPTFFTLEQMASELSPLFGRRRIDLVTAESLHRLIRPYVMRELVPLFEAVAVHER
jgi:predicted nucleotidyltransferase